nr:hypothetical protein [Tanacetum cinerariifolium]
MLTNEMKLTENYQMYVDAFRVDVPTTQSQPIEYTQGTHRTPSTPRKPVTFHIFSKTPRTSYSAATHFRVLQIGIKSQVTSSDSHATISYTLMSSYEVIVNGYYGMPMDPLDPYVQLVKGAPPLPDYIPRPEAPPSPDYIPRPEAPPSLDYIPGPEYPEYLPPADDMLPAEEQPLPAAVSPTAESPGYITESEPEMDPEEEDGDDLSKDDADDEDEEESSDSEEEEEEHQALTVLASALYSSVSASEETEPFEEGETKATPPPFGYRVAARISVQPHILMPFRSKSEVERLLAIPAQEVAHSRDYCTQIMDYCQSGEVHTRILVTQIEALQRDVRPRTVRPTRECTYKDYLNCGPLKFNGTEGIIGLTRWFERTESVSNISNCIAENQVKFASCTLIGSALTWWNSHMRAVGQE